MPPTKPDPVEHDSFTIERRFDAPPAEVFAAWSRPERKRQWFACHAHWTSHGYELDFRVGGYEYSRTGPAGGPLHIYEARYADIVPNARIVSSYTMSFGDTRISTSLLTVEFHRIGTGTRLVLTEQIAVLDARYPASSREAGTCLQLDSLAATLARYDAVAA